MPLKQSFPKRNTRPSEEQEAAAPARRPLPKPVGAGPAQPERPYRAFVESEARKYWEEMTDAGKLAKPTQQEIRAVAMPILCRALRRRQGKEPDPRLAFYRAHQAVDAMQIYAAERGWLKHPFTPSEASPDYIEALVQLADDANWLAKEIPLPVHPGPQHPPIYYTVDPATGRPVPRKDALLRGDYTYKSDGRRITNAGHFLPWTRKDEFNTSILFRRNDPYYSLALRPDNNVEIILHWSVRFGGQDFIAAVSLSLKNAVFSLRPSRQ